MQTRILVSGRPLLFLLLFGLFLFVAANGRASEQVGAVSRFYPSMIDTLTMEPVKLGRFDLARTCGECHPTQYRRWSKSMHSQSFKDPFYRGVLAAAAKEAGQESARLCTGCHSPIGTLADFIWVRDSGEVVSDERVNEGVTCDLCHSIAASRAPKAGDIPGNAGFMVDLSGAKYGPYKDAYSDFHPSVYSELHTTSLFCASCHEIYNPETRATITRTYQEWKASDYAKNGIQCQDCHMLPPQLIVSTAANMKRVEIPGLTSAWDTYRTPFYPHNFTGANVPIPEQAGNYEDADDARSLLSLAAIVTIEDVRYVKEEKSIEFTVAVRNERAGHNLPSGMTEIRQMWLEVDVKDRGNKGARLWRTGAVNESGLLDPQTPLFQAKGVDVDGNPTWKPWRIAKIVGDTTIPPKTTVRFPFSIPVGEAKGPYNVVANLRYRSFDQKLADEYLKIPNYRVPVIIMAAGSAEIEAGE